jgi:hypothetical protein
MQAGYDNVALRRVRIVQKYTYSTYSTYSQNPEGAENP